MNNSVVGFMIRQNSYQGFPSRSCRLLFPVCMAGCSYKVLWSLFSCSPASSDAHQENTVSRIHTDWHQVAANTQAAHSATVWLRRLRLHPSNTWHAGAVYLHDTLKINIMPSIISHVYSDEGAMGVWLGWGGGLRECKQKMQSWNTKHNLQDSWWNGWIIFVAVL